jgi:multidrug resistance efflux pump
MRGKWLLLAGLAVFVGAGAGAYSWWKREHKPPAPVASTQTPVLPPGAEVRLAGKIQAVKIIALEAPVGGTLEEFPVKPGDEVAEGQLLGRIHNTTLEENEKEAATELERTTNKISAIESAMIQARLEASRADAEVSRARSDLTRAERVYQRQTVLNREGATPRKTFEAAEKDYTAAKADAESQEGMSQAAQGRLQKLAQDLDAARKTLAEKDQELEAARSEMKSAELRAPADGVIISIAKQAGADVEKGFPNLVTITTDLGLLEIVLEPEPPVLKRIQPGAVALVQMPELGTAGLPAAVREIKDGKVIVEFGSPDPAIRPGMTAFVALKLP